MDDLAERIKASLENPGGELWFPELTADLTARAWESLHRDLGLAPATYGTERVLSRNLSAPREVITTLKTCPATCATAPAFSIEALTQEFAAQYQKQGVTFYAPDEILHTTILSCIEDALVIIKQVPSLMKSVATLVRSLLVLRPVDEDHDVSFSEPHIPFSIFVSVPEKRIANDGLRVAEAIVHEAMHLQLTLIERVLRLVNNDAGQYFSPWRREFRSANGILHGLYVFSVVDAFLNDTRLMLPIKTQTIHHLINRREEIQRQIAELQSFHKSQRLTELGSMFAQNLIRVDRVMSCAPAKNYR